MYRRHPIYGLVDLPGRVTSLKWFGPRNLLKAPLYIFSVSCDVVISVSRDLVFFVSRDLAVSVSCDMVFSASRDFGFLCFP